MPLYNIPLVPTDLRRSENILQLCDALSYLEQITDDAFNRIETRINENRSRLATINNRINVAQAKIDKIKGSNKAIKVFSSCKFPSPEEEVSFKTLFCQNDPGAASYNVKHIYRVKEKFPIVDDKTIKEKSVLYRTRTPACPVNKLDEQSEGLGRLPPSIESISSLLLFNTTQNP